jgi:hypothetical protein
VRILILKGRIIAAILCLLALTAVFFIKGYEGDKPAAPKAINEEVR